MTADTPFKKALRSHFYALSYLLLSAFCAFIVMFRLFYPLMLPVIQQSGQYAELINALMEMVAYLIPLTLLSLALGRFLLMVVIVGGIAVNAVEVWLRVRIAKK